MIQAYPLQWPEGWPRTPAYRRRPSPFQVGLARARDDLLDQLRLLGAREVVVSTAIPTRRDGLPYAGRVWRQGDDPGVAVYFARGGRPTVIAKDLYRTPEANLRAIGLVVEALRSIERHGGAELLDRAFTGFAALPAPDEIDWRAELGLLPNEPLAVESIEMAYRVRAKRAHPDAGGSDAAMARLNRARDLALKAIGGD